MSDLPVSAAQQRTLCLIRFGFPAETLAVVGNLTRELAAKLQAMCDDNGNLSFERARALQLEVEALGFKPVTDLAPSDVDTETVDMTALPVRVFTPLWAQWKLPKRYLDDFSLKGYKFVCEELGTTIEAEKAKRDAREDAYWAAAQPLKDTTPPVSSTDLAAPPQKRKRDAAQLEDDGAAQQQQHTDEPAAK